MIINLTPMKQQSDDLPWFKCAWSLQVMSFIVLRGGVFHISGHAEVVPVRSNSLHVLNHAVFIPWLFKCSFLSVWTVNCIILVWVVFNITNHAEVIPNFYKCISKLFMLTLAITLAFEEHFSLFWNLDILGLNRPTPFFQSSLSDS